MVPEPWEGGDTVSMAGTPAEKEVYAFTSSPAARASKSVEREEKNKRTLRLQQVLDLVWAGHKHVLLELSSFCTLVFSRVVS